MSAINRTVAATAVVLGIAVSLPAYGQIAPPPQRKVQSIKNTTGIRVNDLHLEWDGAASEIRYRRTDVNEKGETVEVDVEPDSTAHAEGITQADWSTEQLGDNVPAGESRTIRWRSTGNDAGGRINKDASYWTLDGKQVVAEAQLSVGQPPNILHDGATVTVELVNPEPFPITYTDIAIYSGNAIDLFEGDAFLTPTGEPVAAPPGIDLAPGEILSISFEAEPGTYQLAFATAVHPGDPALVFPHATAATVDEPRACCFDEDCLMLSFDECVAAGGWPQPTGSTCEPNPCTAPGGSCADSCGGSSPGGCWCDEHCAVFGDCCDDVCDACGSLCACDPTCNLFTCEGHCGGPSPAACWCDESCCDFGDCCADQAEVCNLCDPGSEPFFPPWDLDQSGSVGVPDLLLLLGQWGPCDRSPGDCAADFDGTGAVGVPDLLVLLGSWGPVAVATGACCLPDGSCTDGPISDCLILDPFVRFFIDQTCEEVTCPEYFRIPYDGGEHILLQPVSTAPYDTLVVTSAATNAGPVHLHLLLTDGTSSHPLEVNPGATAAFTLGADGALALIANVDEIRGGSADLEVQKAEKVKPAKEKRSDCGRTVWDIDGYAAGKYTVCVENTGQPEGGFDDEGAIIEDCKVRISFAAPGNNPAGDHKTIRPGQSGAITVELEDGVPKITLTVECEKSHTSSNDCKYKVTYIPPGSTDSCGDGEDDDDDDNGGDDGDGD